METPLCRVSVFVDYWNYTLSMTNLEAGFPFDWKALPQIMVHEASAMLGDSIRCSFQSMHVFGSYDPGASHDKTKRWVDNTLSRFPGTHVYFVPRQKKRCGPKCPLCYTIHETCPACGQSLRGTEEKGVDTHLATTMIKLAWEAAYDVAVLISSDRDFVPVVRFLQNKGIRIIHASFPPLGSDLSRECWGNIDIRKIMNQLRR